MDKSKIIEQNKNLVLKYPWLLPRNRFSDLAPKDYDFSYTEIDELPDGWRIAFGDSICEEIQRVLEKYDAVNKFRVIQIKEKYGSLRWYHGGLSREVAKEVEEIISKYEDISARTCIDCGKPATKISLDWICPWCDDCSKKHPDFRFKPIKDYFDEIRERFGENNGL